MKIQWKNQIICLAIPLAVGSLSALPTQNNMAASDAIKKPALAPPDWLFFVVWTFLYILMGIASYLVLTSAEPSDDALTAYGIQLVFNFFWSIIFFNLKLYLFAFIRLVALWLLILKTALLFHKISKAFFSLGLL